MKKYLVPSVILALSIFIFSSSIVNGFDYKRDALIFSKGYITSDKVNPSTTFAYSGLNVYTTGKDGYTGDFGILEDGHIELRFRITSDKKVSVHFEDPDGNIIIDEITNKMQYVKTINVKKGNIKFKITSSNNASGQFVFNVIKK